MRPVLRHQILLITLVPVLVIDIFFTFRHYNNEAEQANAQMNNKADIISRHLASASEFYLFSGNTDQIRRLLQQSTRDSEVALAAIYDADGNLVEQARSSLFDETQVAEYFYKRIAIRIQDQGFDDIFATELDESSNQSAIGWVHLYLSKRTLQQAISSALMESLFLFALIMVLAAILSELVSRKINHPIAVLLSQVKRVEQGNLQQQITDVENNELGEVQRGFNQMTQALQNNQQLMNQRIAQATEQLNEAIADLEEKNQELSVARDDAQHANRVKSVFLANMSHEIRTPINGIHGFVGLLADGSLDDTQKRYLDIIDKSVNDLTSIINEILDFSKIESGKLRVVSEIFDLYEVIEQTRDVLYINTLSKNIECYLIIFGDVPRLVIGDKLRLKQILLNLVGNAIKFTEQGQITIKVSVADESTEETDIRISVEDTGIGISNEDQEILFEAFTQVENEENRRFQGTGLGLVISRNLTSLLGGKLSMSSQLHRGSTFEVLLPMKKVDDDEEIRPVEIDLSALVIAGDQTGLAEITSLLARSGITAESCLLTGDDIDQQLAAIASRSRSFVDLVLVDIRQIDLEPIESLVTEITRQVNVLMLGRESKNPLPAQWQTMRYLPVTTSSREFRQLFNSQPTKMASEQPNVRLSQQGQQRVLLVDDNQVNLTLGEELLKSWGHQATAENSSRRALELFKQLDFNIVILDIQMPEIDGVTLMQTMREAKPEPHCLFIAMTATVVDEIDNPFIEAGFDYYLAKPIDRQKFKLIVDGDYVPNREPVVSLLSRDSDLSFDYEKSLSLSADNRELLKQILRMVLRDFPEFRQQLQTFTSQLKFNNLGQVIHKIHGVTCYCSLPRLKKMVSGVEGLLDSYSQHELVSLAEQISKELMNIESEVKNCLERMVA